VFKVGSSEKILKLSKADLGEAWRRARSFVGLSKEGPPQLTEKYDFFHKAFHWTLIALGAFLLISGLTEWEAVQIDGVPVFVLLDRINKSFMDGFLRTGHLVAAMLLAGMVALHIYFAILPQNRPFLKAVSLGSSRSNPLSSPEQEPTKDQTRKN
jgi:cytochrome b subunit of formate dehydrogenase